MLTNADKLSMDTYTISIQFRQFISTKSILNSAADFFTDQSIFGIATDLMTNKNTHSKKAFCRKSFKPYVLDKIVQSPFNFHSSFTPLLPWTKNKEQLTLRTV